MERNEQQEPESLTLELVQHMWVCHKTHANLMMVDFRVRESIWARQCRKTEVTQVVSSLDLALRVQKFALTQSER
jgi:hypothetical protein